MYAFLSLVAGFSRYKEITIPMTKPNFKRRKIRSADPSHSPYQFLVENTFSTQHWQMNEEGWRERYEDYTTRSVF